MNKLILATLLAVSGLGAWAHEDHNHEAAVEAAPHGGMLRNAPPYKTELVLEKDNAKIYVYDKDMKPVDAKRMKGSIKGKLGFPKEKVKKDVKLDFKDGSYQAKLAGIDKVHRYDLHVNIEVDGKTVLGDFGVDNIH